MLRRIATRASSARDALIALAIGAPLGIQTAAEAPNGHELAAGIVVSLLVAGTLAVRRRVPWASAVGSSLALLLLGLLAPHAFDHTTVIFVAVLVGVASLGLHAQGRALWAGAAVTLVCLNASAPLASGTTGSNALWVDLFVFLPAFGAGRVVRGRGALTRELAERARRLEAEREERAERAAAQERNRIAGELHDVVAHGVSSMVVQAAAARRLASADPAMAREAIASIEETGRDALAEMRRLLGVLRRGDEDLALAPQPSLSRIATLLQARGVLTAIGLRIEGEPVPLPVGLDVAAYRVVEEALDATPGEAAEVTIRWSRRELELEVTCAGDGPAEEPDALLGLRERVRLFGGELQAGRRRGGGYGVRARLPVAAPQEAAA